MNYQTLTPELLQELSGIAPKRVFTGSDINEDYSHDEMPIYGKAVPEAVVEVSLRKKSPQSSSSATNTISPLPPAAREPVWWAARCPFMAESCW